MTEDGERYKFQRLRVYQENKAQKKDGEVRGALLSRVIRKGLSDKAIAHKAVKVIKETHAGQKRI